MAAIENEHAYAVYLRENVDDGSDFGASDADYRRLFLGEDGLLRLKDSASAVTFAGGFAGVRVHNSATQAISTGAYASLTFDTERFDTHAFHSTVSNTSRLTVPSNLGGYYVIGGCAGFATNATGLRLARILLNGATRIAESSSVDGNSGADVRVEITTLYALSATDYVEFQLFQNSGGNLNSQVLANSTPEFWMYKVG